MALSQKILLLACGSFNPITNIHLRMFELAKDFFQKKEGSMKYSIVGGILSPTNDAYGKKGLALGTHRVAMAKLGAQSSDWVDVSSWEVDKSEWTRTAEVLTHFQDGIINGSLEVDIDKEAKVKLLCGGDLLESFSVPNLWLEEDIRAIVEKFGIVVITRAGSCPEQYIDNHYVLSTLKDKIEIIEEWVPNEISATKLRTALGRGESIKYLTPDPVIDYITKHGLYQNENS